MFNFRPYMDEELLNEVSAELMLSMPSTTDMSAWDPLQVKDLSTLLSQAQSQDSFQGNVLQRRPEIVAREAELFSLPSLEPDHIFVDMDIAAV